MTDSLPVGFSRGTHRLVSPQATLARIRPLLRACGITRLAAITGLDELGIPVYCAIRPEGLVLQTSAGKGLTAENAQVSALMEAIELYHAENPMADRLHWSTQQQLEARGEQVLGPGDIPAHWPGHLGATARMEWISGESIIDDAPVWAPASTAYFMREPAYAETDTNGLASGNHLIEASLHGLYELLERDALSAVSVNGRLQIRQRCRAVVTASIPDAELRAVIEQIETCDTKVVLLWVPSRVPVHTFWAMLVNRRAMAAVSTLNIGAGCHANPGVAAARAVTEAAQSRLLYIHGARDDLITKPVSRGHAVQTSAAYRFFDTLEPDTRWEALPRLAPHAESADLYATYDWLRESLAAAGQSVFRFDLTRPDIGVPVMKMLAPGLAFNRKLL